jgi:hypothetical protein
MRLPGYTFPVYMTIALLSAAPNLLAVGVKDTVLYCPTGSPCSILDQSFTGPAQFNSVNGPDFVSLYADATAGVLHTLASYGVSAPIGGTGQVNGNAEWIDSLTASSATHANGTQAYLFPTFSVTGFTSGPADAAISFILFGASPVFQTVTVSGGATVSFQPVPIILGPGGTFNFEYAMSSEAYWNPSTLSATSNFRHTAILTGLTVALDQTGTIPVSDITYVSASGVPYHTNGTVPEPAAALLIGSGLLLLTVARIRVTCKDAAAVEGKIQPGLL